MYRKFVLALLLCALAVTVAPTRLLAEDYIVDVNVGGRIVSINLTITDGSIVAKAVDSDVTVNVAMKPPVIVDNSIPYSAKAIVLTPANLRAGPGTNHTVIGSVRQIHRSQP